MYSILLKYSSSTQPWTTFENLNFKNFCKSGTVWKYSQIKKDCPNLSLSVENNMGNLHEIKFGTLNVMN